MKLCPVWKLGKAPKRPYGIHKALYQVFIKYSSISVRLKTEMCVWVYKAYYSNIIKLSFVMNGHLCDVPKQKHHFG